MCAWGLIRTESYPEFEDHREKTDISYEEYQSIVENDNGEFVWQVVSSPDGNYILYAERKDVGQGFSTDEEVVYYRVYSMEDGAITTIFSGYRQFLLVDWK